MFSDKTQKRKQDKTINLKETKLIIKKNNQNKRIIKINILNKKKRIITQTTPSCVQHKGKVDHAQNSD